MVVARQSTSLMACSSGRDPANAVVACALASSEIGPEGLCIDTEPGRSFSSDRPIRTASPGPPQYLASGMTTSTTLSAMSDSNSSTP